MDTLIQDLRYAIRGCLRTPGFTAVAIAALALGIGANSAIFTIVNAALIERLPYADPGRLLLIWEENARRPARANSVGPANYLRWKERAQSFEGMAGFVDTRTNLTGAGDPEELTVQNVTAGFWSIVGVAPTLGRTFTDAESNNPNPTVVMLSHALWQRRFGGDPAIIGRTIQLNGNPLTVIGVMPPDVRLLMKSISLVGKPIDLWAPWLLPATAREPRGRFMSVMARLKPGVSFSQAQSEMKAIAASLSAELPQFDTGWSVKLLSIRDELSGSIRPALLMLAGAVAFVLLIACANVANLLLACGAARQREIAIRGALGAARGRLIRQLLTEALLLGIAGGVIGLLVAMWSLSALLAISPVDLTLFGPVRLSYPVLLFTAAVSLLTTVVCGLAPALAGSRADLQESLKESARQIGQGIGHRRLRQAFVVAEIALAVVLLAGAGLMLRSFATLRGVDIGIDTRNVLTMRVVLPNRKYDTPEKRLRFFDTAVSRIAALPGVKATGAIGFLPYTGLGAGTGFTIVGQPPPAPGQEPGTDVGVCDNGYFQAMRIPLIRGRFFSERELHEKSNVVIINEELARRYFPNDDPMGKSLVIAMTDRDEPTEIIGIVGNMRFSNVRSGPQPTTYWPPPQLPYSGRSFTIRTAGDPLSFAPSVQREIAALDPDQPVSDVRTMDAWVARSISGDRFSSLLLIFFAGVALLLAAIGIYGIMAYSVSQRTAEIGIRLALGAERADILRLIVGYAARLALAGLGIGVVLALALGGAIRSLLFETQPADPVTLAAVVVILGAIALLASYLPARRAARIGPTEALRYQ